MKTRLILSLSVVLLMSAWPVSARADGDSRELAAEGRFVEGLRLMKAGNCAEALPRFRESQELSPASGTLLNIGYCEATIGHPARAWLAYRRALSLAESTNKTNHVELAKSQSEQLEAQLGWISLHVPDQRRWAFSLDSEPLPDSATPSELPTDPGSHALSASVAGKVLFEKVIKVAPGQHLMIDVQDTSTAKSSPATLAPRDLPQALPPQPLPPPSTTESHVAPASAAPTYLLLGSGALVASSVVLFAHARYRYDNADCPNNTCVGAPSADRKAAKTEAIVSYALAGAGLALGSVALVWKLRSSDQGSAQADASIRVTASVQGLGVSGAF